MTQPPTLPLIGWKERLDFPEWGIRRLRTKVDTGARTSALHVDRYEVIESPTGSMVSLTLDLHRPPGPREVTAPLVRLALVKSSNGACELRPVIAALIRLGPVRTRIELTLTNRSGMRFQLILGRQALAGQVVIDPSRAYLLPRGTR